MIRQWFDRFFLIVVALCLMGVRTACAQGAWPSFEIEVKYPPDAGVVDVKAPPYNAKGDGITDDSDAIQRAITDHMKGAILYFPNGTYLISKTLKWSKKNAKGEECWGNFTIQGQSTRGTVLKLKEGTFTDPEKPGSMMWCGGFGSADWFHNYVKNITFDIGTNNAGAIGLQFYSNNTGAVRDVLITAAEGSGLIGLDLGYADMNGPLLVSRVQVRGFRTGIRTAHSVNSQVFEHIRLDGQTECGLHNDGQSLSIRRLETSGAPTGLRNSGKAGFLAIIDSTFSRTGTNVAGAAIENDSPMFARNIQATGFATVLRTSRGHFNPGTNIAEFVSEPILSLFPSPGKSIGLPIKDTPLVPRESIEKWVNVQRFHDGGEDYSKAIQAAIDSGATTIYFPRGAYKIGATVIVRGRVSRFIGLNSWFAESAGGDRLNEPRFRIADQAEPPVVVMENFSGGFGGRPFVEYTGKRTFIFQESDGVPSVFRGEGEVYLEDTTGSPGGIFVFEGPQRVWARQFNVEAHVNTNFPATLDNRGSSIWILGLKTEQGNRLVATRKGGKTEIIGGLVYTVTSHEGRPAFINEDSSMSMSFLERCFMGKPMNPVVRETRAGVSKDLGPNSVIGLYTGYPEAPSASATPAPASYPMSTLSNRWLSLRYYLPDAQNGYYRGARFEWSGLISRVEAGGHSYFSEFRGTHDPLNHDDVCGTAEEFDINNPPGYEQAKPGEPFLKVGIGLLLRPDAEPYAFWKKHAIHKLGDWTVTRNGQSVTFKQVLPVTGKWGYEYTKTIQLHTNAAALSIIRELRNLGGEKLVTEHYGHNFLKIDDAPAGPGYQIEFPFHPRFGDKAQTQDCLDIKNQLLLFTCALGANQAIWAPLLGFDGPGDHRLIIRNTRTRGALTLIGDQALERLVLYSSNGVLCPEPFVKINVPPGQSTRWTTTYVFGE